MRLEEILQGRSADSRSEDLVVGCTSVRNADGDLRPLSRPDDVENDVCNIESWA